MLTKESLEAALPLTEICDNRNIAILPSMGTPLEALVNATRSDKNTMMLTNAGDAIPDLSIIEYLSNVKDPVLKISQHDVAMDDIVDVAVKAIQNHISFAKSVVAPAVSELVETTARTVAEITVSSLTGMDVVIWNPPAPLENSSFDGVVRKFAETAMDVPKLAMNLPSITVKEILDLMSTGSSGIDDDIAIWAASKGDNFFINIWENVFQIKQAELNEREPLTFNKFTEDRTSGIDNALAIFLLSRKLANKPLQNTEMNLATYERLIIEFRNQSGARLCRAIDQLEDISKKQILVREVINNRVTVVYGSVYNKWIKAGGENEILFGNASSGKVPLTTVEQINANAAKFKEAWNSYSVLTSTLESNRKFIRVKEVLLDVFTKQLNSNADTEEFSANNREIVLKSFKEQLNQVKEVELNDLYSLCLKLACRSRFRHTDAERILSGIEQIKKNNPNVSVREAAAVSMISYVSYWLSTQMKVIAI